MPQEIARCEAEERVCDVFCRTSGDSQLSTKGATLTALFESTTHLFIVSGAQTGADRAGLDWAISRGLPHGGWCPKGRRSEDGPIPGGYELQETPSTRYQQRTEWNVRDSDATIIFTLTDALDGGSKLTAQIAERLGKPWMHFRPGVHEKYLAQFIARHGVRRLNVAGKRESSAPGVYAFTFESLDRCFPSQ